MFSTEQRGSLYNDDFRLFFKNAEGSYISPLHDIPLKPEGSEPNVFNMVIEVPRWTNAKMEINLKDKLNPIKQDVKKGKLRFVANCFPHKGYIWNYGAIPQTWEDPDHIDGDTQCKGDGDPVDVCEVGSKIHKRGSVIKVKLLGAVALIDEGETDWKVLAIDVEDPLAADIDDITGLEAKMPGLLAATVEWFKIYKVPDGKPENQFAFDGKAKDATFAVSIVQSLHGQWKAMMEREAEHDSINRLCLSKLADGEGSEIVHGHPDSGAAHGIPESVDKWYYTANM